MWGSGFESGRRIRASALREVDTGEIRVPDLLDVFAAGRIVNLHRRDTGLPLADRPPR